MVTGALRSATQWGGKPAQRHRGNGRAQDHKHRVPRPGAGTRRDDTHAGDQSPDPPAVLRGAGSDRQRGSTGETQAQQTLHGWGRRPHTAADDTPGPEGRGRGRDDGKHSPELRGTGGARDTGNTSTGGATGLDGRGGGRGDGRSNPEMKRRGGGDGTIPLCGSPPR